MSDHAVSIEILRQDGTPTGSQRVLIDENGAVTTAPAYHKQGANYLHDKSIFPISLLAATVTVAVIGPMAEGRWQVASVTEYHQVGSTSGTLQVEVLTGTQAPGAGTAQLTGTISLAAATQTVSQNGTLIASPTIIGPGDRVGIVIAGTMTNLANAVLQISLRRVG